MKIDKYYHLWADKDTVHLDEVDLAEEFARPKGEWKDYIGELDKSMWYREDGLSIFMQCSECGGKEIRNLRLYRNFCPNCGADMRGEE